MQVEFQHGNCSTFRILYNENLRQMYESNKITLSNFYTGQIDKFQISCSVNSSKYSVEPTRSSISYGLILSIIISIAFGTVIMILCYYKKLFRQKWQRFLRNSKTNPVKDKPETFLFVTDASSKLSPLSISSMLTNNKNSA